MADRFDIPPDSLGEIADRVAAEAMAVRLGNGTLTPSGRGRETFKRVIATRRAGLARLLERWSPESHSEVKAILDRLARSLIAELPSSPATR